MFPQGQLAKYWKSNRIASRNGELWQKADAHPQNRALFWNLEGEVIKTSPRSLQAAASVGSGRKIKKGFWAIGLQDETPISCA